jgi:hypothetical protein
MSSDTRRFTVTSVLASALRVAGLTSLWTEPTEQEWGLARDKLDLVLDTLALESGTASAESFDTVDVAADTSTAQLSSSALELLDPVFWADSGQSEPPEAQTQLILVSAQRWRELQGTDTGTPMYVFPYRGAGSIEVRLYPTPSAAGVLRVRTRRMFLDAGAGSEQIELAPFWAQYLIQATAAEIAQDSGLSGNAQLALVRAASLLKKCLGKDSDNVHAQITWSHRTIWSGR